METQKLTHNKIITKHNFPKFVETFNDVVDFCKNLKGDGDVDGNGNIKIDRSVDGYPIIRYVNNLEGDEIGEGYNEKPDTSIQELHQKSIEDKKQTIQIPSQTEGGTPEEVEVWVRQLYNFDVDGTTTLDREHPDDYGILVRHQTQDGKVLEYVTPFYDKVDSEVTSIEQQSLDSKTSEGEGDYIQLHDFDNDSTDTFSIDEYGQVKSGRNDVEFLYRNNKVLKYGTLKIPGGGGGDSKSCDSDIDKLNQKSIETKEDTEQTKYIQLYKFDDETTEDLDIDENNKVVIGEDDSDKKDAEFLVRRTKTNGEDEDESVTSLEYCKLDLSKIASFKRPLHYTKIDDENGIVEGGSIPAPIAPLEFDECSVNSASDIYAHIDITGGQYYGTIDQTPRANSMTHVQFKIYELNDDMTVKLDSRPMVFPVLDTNTYSS